MEYCIFCTDCGKLMVRGEDVTVKERGVGVKTGDFAVNLGVVECKVVGVMAPEGMCADAAHAVGGVEETVALEVVVLLCVGAVEYVNVLAGIVGVALLALLAAFLFSFTLAFDCVHAIPLAAQLIFLTLVRHVSRSLAVVKRSSHVIVSGMSIRRSPHWRLWNMNSTTFLTSLCSLVCAIFFIRKMWPSHFSLRDLIHRRMLKVVVLVEASSRLDFPVM